MQRSWYVRCELKRSYGVLFELQTLWSTGKPFVWKVIGDPRSGVNLGNRNLYRKAGLGHKVRPWLFSPMHTLRANWLIFTYPPNSCYGHQEDTCSQETILSKGADSTVDFSKSWGCIFKKGCNPPVRTQRHVFVHIATDGACAFGTIPNTLWTVHELSLCLRGNIQRFRLSGKGCQNVPCFWNCRSHLCGTRHGWVVKRDKNRGNHGLDGEKQLIGPDSSPPESHIGERGWGNA